MDEKNARDYTIQLQQAVEGRSVTFTQTYFKRYAREFKTAIDKDKIPHRLLEKAIPYIAEFWDTQQLSIQKAVSGVQGREPVKQTAAERTKGYEEFFELTPRQQRIMERIRQIGKETALAGLRGELNKDEQEVA